MFVKFCFLTKNPSVFSNNNNVLMPTILFMLHNLYFKSNHIKKYTEKYTE